jgi:hypothetical protein
VLEINGLSRLILYWKRDTVIFWSVGVEIRRETSQNPGWLGKANSWIKEGSQWKA